MRSKRIGILVNHFMGWNGGIDFIKHLIWGLQESAQKYNGQIIIVQKIDDTFIKKKGRFYKLKHYYLKRLLVGYFYNKKPDRFKEFNNIGYLTYSNDNQLAKLLCRKKIFTLLPLVFENLINIPIQKIGYLPDCQHKYYPNYFTAEEIKDRDFLFKKVVATYLKIIVNANSVKEDLINFFEAKQDQIFVLPFTPKLHLEYLKDNSCRIEKYNLSEKYFIISNQFWQHKDHPTAFRAFSELIKTDKYKNLKLICTGLLEDYRNPKYIGEQMQLIKDLGIVDKVIFLGLIPKIEQIEIMKGAIAVIQPTLFEGGPGGGSVWDAISLGIPSIVSDIKTNLEVKHKMLTFFQSGNYIDLTDKMEKVLNTNFIKKTHTELMEQSESNMKKLGDYLWQVIFK